MGKKILLILSGIFITLLLLAIIGWQVVKATPQYSLYQVYSAIEKHDYKSFKKYVDVEDISNNMVDKVIASASDEAKKDAADNDDPFYQLGYNLGLGLFTQMKPRLKEEVVSGIKKSVEEGSFKKEYKPKNILDYYSDISVKRSGKVAEVSIKTQGKEDLKLKMRDMDGYWQIFDMALPAPKGDISGSQDSTTTKTKFGERTDITQGWFLIVGAPEEYKPSGYSSLKDGNKYVAVKITFENTSDSPNSYTTSNFKLKDNKDFSYSNSYDGKEPRIESGDLEAKGRVSGYMTFKIPSENIPVSVIYSGIKSIIFTSPNPSASPSAKAKK